MLDFRSSNANRSPDWRWQLGKHFAEARFTPRRIKTDRWVGLAKVFAARLINCQTEEQHLILLDHNPDLYEAWAVYNDGKAKASRWCIEARLLAAQSTEEIARLTGNSAETITLYEKLFFNVSDKLDQIDYITNNVFTDAVHRGITDRTYDLLWKMYGYWAGASVLDFVMHKFTKAQKPDSNPSAVIAYLIDDIRGQQVLKTATAMRTMPVNWQTQIEIANLYYRMLEMERQHEGGGPGGQEAFQASVKTFLASVPWSSGLSGTASNLVLAQADSQAQALRAAELLTIGAGQIPPGLEALLASAKFPEEKVAPPALPALTGPVEGGMDAAPSP